MQPCMFLLQHVASIHAMHMAMATVSLTINANVTELMLILMFLLKKDLL